MAVLKKKMDPKLRNGLLAGAALIIIMLLAYNFFGPKAVQGAKTVTVEVVDDTGEITSYVTHTDAGYLRQVLEETEGLTVEGTESDYGLMIETVNGLRAEYDENGAYWSVYVNGEYGNYGVDSQPVTDGDTYTLAYTEEG